MGPLSPISVLALGFTLGLKHATDADHVVAVTTIVSRQRKLSSAAMVGITWGIGHTLMIIIVGVAIILFHISIPEKTQLSFEFIVALALIALGVANLTGATKRLQDRLSGVHSHIHGHDHPHMHVHRHNETLRASAAGHEAAPDFLGEFGSFHLARSLVVGIIHGLAGSAAITLLVLGSIPDERLGIIYLGIFGFGTVVGMTAVTILLGIPIMAGNKKFARFDRIATILAGILSIAYGAYFGYRVGFLEGLFR